MGTLLKNSISIMFKRISKLNKTTVLFRTRCLSSSLINRAPLLSEKEKSHKIADSHGFPDWLEKWTPAKFKKTAAVGTFVSVGSFLLFGPFSVLPYVISIPTVAFTLRGIEDLRQVNHSVLRNYPVLGHLRWLFESIRPEIRQYFIESDQEASPFSREQRSMVYQRAKRNIDALSFGTRRDVYAPGYEFIFHSIWPTKVPVENQRVMIGSDMCTKPYSSALLNVSGMSFGALGKAALLALNGAAKDGNFYHNTGEGGVSPYHLQPGGDLVWNIGAGYFGCRNEDGTFSLEQFTKMVKENPQIKMIEIKLSQGAKPGKGGHLPGSKVSEEIAATRNIPVGQDCVSPPQHSAFTHPNELMEFADTLRKASGGLPIGIKMCVGRPEEAASIARAMVETGKVLDFVTVDGAEGGTGAAPAEFSNHVGAPLYEGMRMWSALLSGTNLRERGVKMICAGKITSGFTLVKLLALGADVCNAARPFMFSIGCIQSLKCHTDTCPSGVATQNPRLQQGLHVPTKRLRATRFQESTVKAALGLIGAAGVSNPQNLAPRHIVRRINQVDIQSYDKMYPPVAPGCLLNGAETPPPGWLLDAWLRSAEVDGTHTN